MTTQNPIFFLAVNIYQLVLVAMALRAVNKFSWSKTLITLLAAVGAMAVLVLLPIFFLMMIVQ